EHRRVTGPGMRLYHSMYQLFSFTMLLVLTTNNLGVMWVAMEAATLTTVLLVALYRTHASLEAAWKYFILCRVVIAQALFGTILVYFAAEKVLGPGTGSLLWTHLDAVKTELQPTVMSIAFVFLLVGYGTKVGLVPLHNWLPDAHAEGPTPISAVLSGLLLNVALYALIRCKVMTDGALERPFASALLMGFGLISVAVAAFFLSRQRDVKRMFAYSSIEHMGLITFAFGMGGPVASFAGLLHMTVHSLTKSAIFFTAGHAAQQTGTQLMANIRGLAQVNPTVGWGLMLGTVAILGMPPFGAFASELLILPTTIAVQPGAAPLPGAVPAWRASVDSDGWRRVCEAVAGSGGRLGALWASDERDRGAGFALHAVLVAFEGLVCVDVRLEGETCVDVSDLFPVAGRMQRAIADLMGLRAGMRDTRGWLRHGAWREDAFPLRREVALD